MRISLFIFFMVIFIGCSENDIIDEGEKPEDPQAEIESVPESSGSAAGWSYRSRTSR